MNYFLGIDIAKTNHVASLINNNGDVVIRAIKFTNSKEGGPGPRCPALRRGRCPCRRWRG